MFIKIDVTVSCYLKHLFKPRGQLNTCFAGFVLRTMVNWFSTMTHQTKVSDVWFVRVTDHLMRYFTLLNTKYTCLKVVLFVSFQFCMTMCIFFLALNFIARNLSGYLFVYVLLLVTFFGPLLISKLPEEHVESFKNAVKVVARSEGMKVQGFSI